MGNPSGPSLELGQLGDVILQKTVAVLGSEWEKWKPSDRELVEAATLDAARVYFLAMVDPQRAAGLKVSIESQMKDIKTSAGESAGQVIFRVLAEILSVAVPILVKSVL